MTKPVRTKADYSANIAHNVSDILVPYQLPITGKFNGIMFVAEAPGEKEMQLRMPLVGASGVQFDAWLAEAKIERTHSLIANVFRFRPNNNKVENFFVHPKYMDEQGIPGVLDMPRFRGKYLKQAFEGELSRLRRAVIKYKPSIIVSMGATAAWAFLGQENIGELTGRIFERHIMDNRRNKRQEFYLLPSYHPSAALAYRDADGLRAAGILAVFNNARRMAAAIEQQNAKALAAAVKAASDEDYVPRRKKA